MTGWLTVERGEAPLVVAVPHAGIDLVDVEEAFRSPEVARRDADWWVDRLYGFAGDLGATVVRTAVSRSVIDVNRDPSGASLYPGMVTTELCPTTTFDGEALYPRDGPDAAEIARRRERWFDPYHAALAGEIDRLRGRHGRVVVYDAHSIRSRVARLFEGELPLFNIGTFDGVSCSPALTEAVRAVCVGSSHVVDGRFKGGWTTRHYGAPERGVHAIQMELAMRGYLDEAGGWPPVFDAGRAAGMMEVLREVLRGCLRFAGSFPLPQAFKRGT
ncbi:N-formylglutamate deformylase [Sphingobium chlorophenolicum]|uniref:N-formylglutamate deformylase n=1 Tax=Sphingobium chlorophenolicum TaxID=46429 RepID=A0A081R832_SPHCR|nr:N-formylglutamate deformylase [Sphingobium chlorophenolicum]KEQ51355.1 N-formylglutamate deformylase [Sphingobium chlorophenolicum]